MKLRIKFSKHGALKFIGHLDVMRYFQKAIRRAGIDISYSAGFSPHQIMSFASPLGIGLESNGEYMDIEVNSLSSAKEFVDALNAQMVEGIKVLEVRLLPENAGNAMASVAAAKYTVSFREGHMPSFLSRQAVADFYEQKEIMVTKKTKKSESTFDMKPFIFECRFDEAGGSIILTVDASSAGNIKPSLVIKALYEFNHQELDEFVLLITREETYTNAGTVEDIRLEPLGFVGSDY
ncbi:MAG: TIGR03936 family radical SAM-associated protein [Lachnospiraceae bacterium]|nr:TIGR03936 family radical SAM-associated protein [Lachnospiraceae bacterium]